MARLAHATIGSRARSHIAAAPPRAGPPTARMAARLPLCGDAASRVARGALRLARCPPAVGSAGPTRPSSRSGVGGSLRRFPPISTWVRRRAGVRAPKTPENPFWRNRKKHGQKWSAARPRCGSQTPTVSPSALPQAAGQPRRRWPSATSTPWSSWSAELITTRSTPRRSRRTASPGHGRGTRGGALA